jgi:hypothetical protein
MPTVVFTHAATDRALWASKHSERVAAFALWRSNVVEYLSAGGGNHDAVSVDVHDMSAMQAALGTPEIDAAKRAHGVIDPITMHVAYRGHRTRQLPKMDLRPLFRRDVSSGVLDAAKRIGRPVVSGRRATA